MSAAFLWTGQGSALEDGACRVQDWGLLSVRASFRLPTPPDSVRNLDSCIQRSRSLWKFSIGSDFRLGFWIYFGGAPCIAGFQQQGRDLLGIVANAIPVMQGIFVRFLAGSTAAVSVPAGSNRCKADNESALIASPRVCSLGLQVWKLQHRTRQGFYSINPHRTAKTDRTPSASPDPLQVPSSTGNSGRV